jgi:hypothetical protein
MKVEKQTLRKAHCKLYPEGLGSYFLPPALSTLFFLKEAITSKLLITSPSSPGAVAWQLSGYFRREAHLCQQCDGGSPLSHVHLLALPHSGVKGLHTSCFSAPGASTAPQAALSTPTHKATHPLLLPPQVPTTWFKYPFKRWMWARV